MNHPMELEERLAKIESHFHDGEFDASIVYDHLERQFTDDDRMLILHSKINYSAGTFSWESVIPTVKIPYRDPSLGFLVDGAVFAIVGIYSRAPGIVSDTEARVLASKTVEEPKVTIINTHNSTVSIGYKRNAVHILFKRGGKEYKVAIGVFLKALSGLPYGVILDQFAYKPQLLLNSFPCEIPKGREDLALMATYGIEHLEEPTIDECVNAVYSALTPMRGDSQGPKYTTHWKLNRINAFLNNLHFKTRQKYEATLSLASRSINTYLDEDIRIPYFSSKVERVTKKSLTGATTTTERVVETIEEFYLPAGHYMTADDAEQLAKFELSKLRVKTTRSFILQEEAPVVFRAKGCKLVDDVEEVGAKAGTIIDDELLDALNNTKLTYLEVYSPAGRKTLHRSGEDVELGDFYTILNYLFTHPYMKKSDSTQYEVSNRVIIDYDKQVANEVEQTYNDIITSISGAATLKNLLDAFPSLPSTQLVSYLRNSKHKEVAQSDITNPMARAITDTKASALLRETPGGMMAVQKGQYARLDSLHAPESNKIGSVQQLTVHARINPDTSEIEAPYEKVVNGEPTGKIEYLTASQEANKYIVSWDCSLDTPSVLARLNDDITTIERTKVDYRDPSPFCDMSISRMCIPFPGFAQPKRAIMATKMNGQAVPVLFPERPLVGTGAETEVPGLYYTGRKILEVCGVPVVEGLNLELIQSSWKKNLVEYSFSFGDQVFAFAVPFTATDKATLYSYDLNLNHGNWQYGLDDIVLFNHCCDMKQYDFWIREKQGTLPLVKDCAKPAMALGVNLTVGYKTYGSSTVDDAVTISSRLISDNVLSSIQIIKYDYKLRQDELYSDAGWSIPLHDWVYEGQPVIRVIRDRTRGDHDKLSEKTVLCRQTGEVVYSHKDNETGEAEVWVMTLHRADVGDKVAGRYGNKSVIAKIVPEEMMPYDPTTGQTLDIVCNPLGLPSRMNFGQVLEVALGGVMKKDGKRAVCTPFYPNIKGDILDMYNNAGMKPIRLFNPVYGKMTERPVMVGVIYMMKLEQISNMKLSAVGYPTAVDPVFGQPIDSINQDKGQAVGEMESWALIASGAHKVLNDFHTIYSGDEEARQDYFDAMTASEDNQEDPWDETPLESSRHSANKNALVTQLVFRSFGCDLEVIDNRYVVSPLNMDDIQVELTAEEFANGYERVKDFEWFKVPLAAPVINPFWINNFPLTLVLGIKSIRNLVDRKVYLDINRLYDRENCFVAPNSITESEKLTMLTGIEAVIELVKNTTIDDALTRLRMRYDPSMNSNVKRGQLDEGNENETIEAIVLTDEDAVLEDLQAFGGLADVPMNVADVIRLLERMKRQGRELSSLIWYELPIMPRMFRQANVIGDREREHSFQMQLRSMCSSRSTSQAIYTALCSFIGYSTAKQEDLVSIRGYFFGRGSQSHKHGKVRSAVLSKRVGFSGRVVIVPMDDYSISPYFIELPWRCVCVELGKVLGVRLAKRSHDIYNYFLNERGHAPMSILSLDIKGWQTIAESLGDFNHYLFSNYFNQLTEEECYFLYYHLRSIVRKIVEGDVTRDGKVWYEGKYWDPQDLPENATIDCCVVSVGRQPTLHKKSIRCYFGILGDGWCMRIHPLVCEGYNADFDGDQMWHVQLFGQGKLEACSTISVMQDLISERDGSFTLGISQDTALGLYCATTLKDNVIRYPANSEGQYYFFDNLEGLKMQVEYGDLHYYDAVVYKHPETGSMYCSTAGRILVNGAVPGAFTQMPFTDPVGVCEATLGPEAKSLFKELRYDTIWTVTGITAKERNNITKAPQVLQEVYAAEGPRTSIMTAQRLYEIGVVASDIYSVTVQLDDMSSSVDKSKYMDAPRAEVRRLNSLYLLGLITDEQRKQSSVHAWDIAKKSAQEDIIAAMDPTSNIYYMMYSGARGKPDQIMQTVGFIGTISKTTTSDIEYPILKGYGEGLSSFDLMQTRHTARIGMVSTQAGTQDTGYATRQSVYMMSGLGIREGNCGIDMRLVKVEYSSEKLKCQRADGSVVELESLIGEFMDSSTEGFDILRSTLTRSGYMITQAVIDLVVQHGISRMTLLDEEVEVVYTISDSWRQGAIEELYSYALPFTENMKVTDKTVDWIESHGLKEVIGFDKDTFDSNEMFDREAYLPVEYNTMEYTIHLNGSQVAEEALYALSISPDSPGIHYYKRMLTDTNSLTGNAIRYLTKKRVRQIVFEGGQIAEITYKLSDLFKDVVVGRISAGLPYLDSEGCITEETLDEIEKLQLAYIPVRTSLTCFSKGGICMCCYGKSLSTKQFQKVGDNLGIAAAQAMCAPLSQATLDVAHSGGKRSAGTAMVSGLSYYMRMLQGSMTTERTASQLERFAPIAGYIEQNPHNKSFIQIVPEDKDAEPYSFVLDDVGRLNVPNGAYVDVNDTIVVGLPNLTRYDSTDVFDSALKTRYLLMREYHNVFKALDVSARNTEVLSRAQTSICYLVGKGSIEKTKDTGIEAANPTGDYKLTVSDQAQVVSWFSGIAGYGFENVANMILLGLLTPKGLEQNSCLGNLIVGSKVGSTTAQFLPKRGGAGSTKVHKSALKTQMESVESRARIGDYSAVLQLGAFTGDANSSYSPDNEEEIFRMLLAGESSVPELPEQITEESIDGTAIPMPDNRPIVTEDTSMQRMSLDEVEPVPPSEPIILPVVESPEEPVPWVIESVGEAIDDEEEIPSPEGENKSKSENPDKKNQGLDGLGRMTLH